MKLFQSGQLDRRITLHAPIEEGTAFSGNSRSYSNVATACTWAAQQIPTGGASEGVEGHRQSAVSRVNWHIRYRNDVKPTWQVRYNGQTYDIIQVIEVERKKLLQLITQLQD